MDEKVIGILAAAVGVAPTEAAELITTDEGIAQLQTKLTAKVADVRKDADGRALKIVTQAFKAAGVESDVFDKDRDFKGNVSAAVEVLKTQSAADSGKDLTDEQVLRLPVVKAKLNELTTATDRKVQEAVDKVKSDFQTQVEAFARQQIAAKVTEKAAAVLAELNPVFSQNAERAATQRADLLSRIASGQFVEVGGELFPADADGEVLKDTLGNAVKLTDLVRQTTTKLYDLPVSSQRDSAGVSQRDVAPKVAYDGPKTQEEVDEKVAGMARETPAARAKVQTDFTAWQATHSS